MSKIDSVTSGRKVDKPGQAVSDGDRRDMIAQAAYFRASERGFSDGDALGDWLLAEKEIDGGIPRRRR
jgi:hypothetical protein